MRIPRRPTRPQPSTVSCFSNTATAGVSTRASASGMSKRGQTSRTWPSPTGCSGACSTAVSRSVLYVHVDVLTCSLSQTQVVKSCIAMAYPPSSHQNLYWKPGQVPPFRERIPPGMPKSQFIHFDIDPNNGKYTATPSTNLIAPIKYRTDPPLNSPRGRDRCCYGPPCYSSVETQ
jgi:hypothetical protein